MSKFKVGDTVEILAEGWDHPVGAYVAVVEDGTNEFQFVENGRAEVSRVNDFAAEFRLVPKVVEAEKPAEQRGPNIPAYAVLKDGQVKWVTSCRSEARSFKAVLGGKAEGAVLYKLTIEKEVR